MNSPTKELHRAAPLECQIPGSNCTIFIRNEIPFIMLSNTTKNLTTKLINTPNSQIHTKSTEELVVPFFLSLSRTNMFAQVPKLTLSPSQISITCPTRKPQYSNRKRTNNHVYDPKMEGMGSVEDDLPFNTMKPNLLFSTGPISSPPQRVVRFNKGQYCLRATSQAATGYVATGEALAVTGVPSGSGKSTLLDLLAGLISLFFSFLKTNKIICYVSSSFIFVFRIFTQGML